MTSAVIVGAGVFGASIAHRLAGDGWKVTLVEQHEPGHDGASSGGGSRLLRCVHGPHAWYAPPARRARTLWGGIEGGTGASPYEGGGGARFSRAEGGWGAGAPGAP